MFFEEYVIQMRDKFIRQTFLYLISSISHLLIYRLSLHIFQMEYVICSVNEAKKAVKEKKVNILKECISYTGVKNNKLSKQLFTTGENQMADFGNVQNLPFAFFP